LNEALMPASLRDTVQAIVQQIIASSSFISDTTRLYHDLRISGADAVELIANIHDRFGTKFEGFVLEDFFPNEIDGFIYNFARIFGIYGKYRAITFCHLVAVVERGSWFESEL
jgi:hypothetical protein